MKSKTKIKYKKSKKDRKIKARTYKGGINMLKGIVDKEKDTAEKGPLGDIVKKNTNN